MNFCQSQPLEKHFLVKNHHAGKDQVETKKTKKNQIRNNKVSLKQTQSTKMLKPTLKMHEIQSFPVNLIQKSEEKCEKIRNIMLPNPIPHPKVNFQYKQK